MATKYRKGLDTKEPGADFITFRIDESYMDPVQGECWWNGKIEVHGDEDLRDKILAGLQGGVEERLTKLEAWAHEPFDFTDLVKRLEHLEKHCFGTSMSKKNRRY